MNKTKEFILNNVNFTIKDYAYITVDDDNQVIQYELSDTLNDINPSSMEDFLESHREIIGIYSGNKTFVTKGHNTLISDNVINDTLSDYYKYCHVTITDIKFLSDNIRKFADLLVLDLSEVFYFNYSNMGLVLDNLEELDEIFENNKVTRVYKKYNCYFIFY